MRTLDAKDAIKGVARLLALAALVSLLLGALAAALFPRFLCAQGSSRVSRVQADQRSLATALSSYWIDHGAFPPAALPGRSTRHVSGARLTDPLSATRAPVSVAGGSNRATRHRPSFATAGLVAQDGGVAGNGGGRVLEFATLTTPVSYMTYYFSDGFAEREGVPFAYLPDGDGFLVASYGPDSDALTGGTLIREMRAQFINREATPFDGRDVPGSRARLQVGTNTTSMPGLPADGLALTYDPTNGAESPGDIWRTSD